MTDAIVLAIVIPIVSAALTAILGIRFERSGWTIATIVSAVVLGLSGEILLTVIEQGRQSYAVAGFAPPAGIELVGDSLSAPVSVLIAVVALGVLAYARKAGPRGNSFYVVFLLLIGGLNGVTLTGDLFNMYVFLEITGLAAYALVASGESTRSAIASLKYLILGTVGASLFLLGVGYAFLATGTLNMVDLSEQFATAGYGSRLVLASFGLIVTGLTVKAALFPVHSWQPDAYSSAPDSVSMLISALVSTVAAYAIARVLFTVYTVDFFAAIPAARTILLTAATISIVAGSVLAVLQTDIKRMLAYSSVSQFGMIVAAFALANTTSATGGFVHLIGHGIMKGGLFAAAGLVTALTGARKIDEYAGLASRKPLAAGAFSVLALALVGVPPAIGFVGKWYIALGAVESGLWPVAAVILVSTVLTLAYFAGVIERMYFRNPVLAGEDADATGTPATDGGSSPVSLGMVLVVVVAAVTAVALGLAGTALAGLFESALEGMIDTTLTGGVF
jgi:multicomponent Na+:H+ antiporter subunit D